MAEVSPLGFYLVSLVSVVAAMYAVGSSKLLNAALSLALCFFAVGGLYALLGSNFLFILQLVINAGAIPIVTVFIIMMTQSRITRLNTKLVPYFAVIFLGFGVAAIRYIPQLTSFNSQVGGTPSQVNPAPVEELGTLMLSSPETNGQPGTLLAFEVASIILLVAMVGAVVLARREGETIKGRVGMLADETPVSEGEGRPAVPTLGVQGVAPMPRATEEVAR